MTYADARMSVSPRVMSKGITAGTSFRHEGGSSEPTKENGDVFYVRLVKDAGDHYNTIHPVSRNRNNASCFQVPVIHTSIPFSHFFFKYQYVNLCNSCNIS